MADGPSEEDKDHFVTPNTNGKRLSCQVVLGAKSTTDNG